MMNNKLPKNFLHRNIWGILRIITLFVGILFFSTTITQAAGCPDFTKFTLTSDEAITRIDACIEARKNGNPNSITDYNCPSGEYALEDSRPLSDERLAYSITSNLLMNEVDKQVKEYMKTLQDSRNKDALAWTEDLRTCLLNNPEGTTVRDAYNKICQFSFIQNFLNNNSTQRIMISTIAAYPQETCAVLAKKKVDAWNNLGINLMNDGINKSYQNDSDQFFSNVKWAYQRVLEKFHSYQRIISRASSKIDAYIRNPVK